MAYTRLLAYTAPGSVHARGLGAEAPHAAKRQEWQRMLASVADFPTPAGPARINNLGEEYPPGSGARPVALLSHALTRSTVFG